MVNPSGLMQNEINQLQLILDKRFTSGAFFWVGGYAFKDYRNHPIHPSRGYQYAMFTKVAVHSNLKDNPRDTPLQNLANDLFRTRFGFIKVDFDGSWYTPLIGERDLVLGLHGHMGIVGGIGSKTIPFRELYHIGGPSSVRGFLFGEIGPMYTIPRLAKSDMLGAKKGILVKCGNGVSGIKRFFYEGCGFFMMAVLVGIRQILILLMLLICVIIVLLFDIQSGLVYVFCDLRQLK